MSKAKLIAVVVVVFFLTAGWGTAAEKKEENKGMTLFENNCGKCHNLDRPKSKKKTKDEWSATVLRMKQKGMSITDNEANMIINHLAEIYK